MQLINHRHQEGNVSKVFALGWYDTAAGAITYRPLAPRVKKQLLSKFA